MATKGRLACLLERPTVLEARPADALRFDWGGRFGASATERFCFADLHASKLRNIALQALLTLGTDHVNGRNR